MIREMTGDIFQSGAEVLVNPVNTVGVMGAGLAARFKAKYPEMFSGYENACATGELRIGRIVLSRVADSRHIAFFPTKEHWRDDSRLEWIDWGLIDVRHVIQVAKIRSIAIPALGCGLGGLDWADVRPLIVKRLEGLDDVNVMLYGPG